MVSPFKLSITVHMQPFSKTALVPPALKKTEQFKKFALWLIGISDLGGCFSFSCYVQNFHFGRRNILVSWDSEKIIATPPVETIWVLALLVSSKIKLVLMESLQLTDWKQPGDMPIITYCSRYLRHIFKSVWPCSKLTWRVWYHRERILYHHSKGWLQWCHFENLSTDKQLCVFLKFCLLTSSWNRPNIS